MSEESDTTKKAFLLFGDALRSMNSTQQHTNTILERHSTLLVDVVTELKALHRGHQEIIQRMDAAEERRKDMERRMSDAERKSDGKIKVLERRLDEHAGQIATLRQAVIKA